MKMYKNDINVSFKFAALKSRKSKNGSYMITIDNKLCG